MDIDEKRENELNSILLDLGLSKVRHRMKLGFIGFGLGMFLIVERTVPPNIGIALVVASAILGAYVGYRYSNNKTWEQSVYAKLTAYDPLDKEAYRTLQSLAAEGKLKIMDIHEWALHELMALNPTKTKTLSDDDNARQLFADKKVY